MPVVMDGEDQQILGERLEITDHTRSRLEKMYQNISTCPIFSNYQIYQIGSFQLVGVRKKVSLSRSPSKNLLKQVLSRMDLAGPR
jgi:hypothetical protein